MPDPERLVHIVDDVPELAGGSGVPMVMVLDGFLDAGNAAAHAAQHLVERSDGGRVVATFEVDEFHDYRARRPAMSFVRDHYEQYDAPRLVVRLLTDAGDTPGRMRQLTLALAICGSALVAWPPSSLVATQVVRIIAL